MIITCPNCATGFKVAADVFSDGARKVRCAQCGHSWLQELPAQNATPSAPVDEIADDSEFGLPEEEAAEADFDDFGVEMPELESVSQDEPPQEGDPVAGTGDGDKADEPDDFDLPAVPHDIETEAQGSRKKSSKSSGAASLKRRKWISITAIAASVALLAGGGVYYRQAVSSYLPALAGVYSAMGLPVNLLGVDFAGVRLQQKYENGFPVLSVQGEVVNISGKMRRVPDVRLGLRGPGGQEIYHWSINIGRTELGPNERVKFVTRLASPPEEANKIIIKFDTPRLRRLGAL